MGFHSYKCAKSKVSIPAFPYANLPIEASHVVALTPNGGKFESVYDGYGNVGATNIIDQVQWELYGNLGKFSERYDEIMQNIKLVRKDHYNGETFEELETSESCIDQGYFYGAEEREEILNTLVNQSKGATK